MSNSIVVHPESFIKDMEKFQKEIYNKTKEFSEEFVQDIQDASRQEVPVDTGSLANSQFVDDTSEGETISFEFGYGGGNEQTNPKNQQSTAEYAVQVHEDLTVAHPNGKAKFLEDPCNAAKDKFANDLAKALR